MALTPWPTTPMAQQTAVAQLRAALKEPANESDPHEDDALDTELKRLGASVWAVLNEYAGKAPPQDVRDEALVRGVSWLRDTRGAQRFSSIQGVINFEPAPVSSAAWFRSSGAASLLSAWRIRRAGVL